MTLTTDAQARKNIPVYSGFVKYFPNAMAAVAELSRIGNDQHNPGRPLRWNRSKSGDELDACMRHLMEAGTIDTDGVRHSAKAAWRAMANLEKELEAVIRSGVLFEECHPYLASEEEFAKSQSTPLNCTECWMHKDAVSVPKNVVEQSADDQDWSEAVKPGEPKPDLDYFNGEYNAEIDVDFEIHQAALHAADRRRDNDVRYRVQQSFEDGSLTL